MKFPTTRLRRLRLNPQVRQLVRETRIDPASFLAPLFLVPGTGVKREIPSLPGQYHLSEDTVVDRAKRLHELGIPGVLLFGIPESKDVRGSSACQDDGVVQRGIMRLREEIPDLLVVTDLCFCEYTSHGHCGIMKREELDNDSTLKILVEQALSHARAGAGMIAPSGMIDGAVGAIRNGLDESGFQHLPIMGYSAKYASAFYGPFREAVQSAPTFGDRKSYQMDPANREEALREVELDLGEGADIVMIKPALAFLDIIAEVKARFRAPTAAYNVSGEYAMVKAAGEKGWIDATKVMIEMLTSIKRAGADIIITYFAEEYAELYRAGEIEP